MDKEALLRKLAETKPNYDDYTTVYRGSANSSPMSHAADFFRNLYSDVDDNKMAKVTQSFNNAQFEGLPYDKAKAAWEAAKANPQAFSLGQYSGQEGYNNMGRRLQNYAWSKGVHDFLSRNRSWLRWALPAAGALGVGGLWAGWNRN